MTIEITSAIFKKPLTWIIILVSLVLIGAGIFAFKPPSPPNKLVEEMGKLIDLPTGEQPTIVTITDTTKLAGQELFQKTQNGDVILIYAAAKKAYLYRPSTNKILDVQPIKVTSPPLYPPKLQ